MIAVRNKQEIERIKVSCGIVRDTLEMISEHIVAGITTKELDDIIRDYIYAQNAVPSFLNYHGYPACSCISVNDVVVHGIPSSRVIEKGDIVSVDVGAVKNNYHGDGARTFAVGEISEDRKLLNEVTKQSFFEGIRTLKAGSHIGDIGERVQAYVEKNGCSVVRDLVGHGIGRRMHEEPSIPNFHVDGETPIIKAGNCLAIEPMVNRGGYAVKFMPDGWTCKTVDGSDSSHYENTILVLSDGVEILTAK